MVIAKIKLSPGNAGWYDYLTGIHLTIANPIAEVHAEMNLERIRIGLAYKTIELISGTVKEEEIIKKIESQQPAKIEKVQVCEVVKQEEAIEQAEAIQQEEKQENDNTKKKAKKGDSKKKKQEQK